MKPSVLFRRGSNLPLVKERMGDLPHHEARMSRHYEQTSNKGLLQHRLSTERPYRSAAHPMGVLAWFKSALTQRLP